MGLLGSFGVDRAEKTRETRSVSSLAYLAAVNVVIWVGLFFYLWRLDARLAERERGERLGKAERLT
jgi:CcmD family protein